MWRTSLWSVIVFVGLFSIASGLAAQNAVETGLAAKDQRLDQTVTVDRVGITLPELLSHLSTHDLQLTCDSTCSEQKLQIRLKSHPVRLLLSALAALLPGTWEQRKEGYHLVMSPSAVSQRDRWWQVLLEARKTAIEAMSTNLLESMRTPPEQALIVQQGTPPPGFVTEKESLPFFYALSAEWQERIAKNMGDPGNYTVSHFVSADNDASSEATLVFSFSDLPSAAQSAVENLQRKVQPSAVFSRGSFIRFTTNLTSIHATLLDESGKQILSSMMIHPAHPITAELMTMSGDLSVAPIFPQLMDKSVAHYWETLMQYQRRRFWENPPPAHKHIFSNLVRRADVLRWLAKQADLEFVADYYSQPGMSMPNNDPLPGNSLSGNSSANNPLPGPVDVTLNDVAWELDSSWKKVGQIVLMRNNRWYRDDRLEVPAALATSWLAVKVKQDAEAPPNPFSAQGIRTHMDWAQAFATRLTKWQIANGLKWLRNESRINIVAQNDVVNTAGKQKLDLAALLREYPFLRDAGATLAEYNLVQFYTGLDATQQQALWNGQLRVGDLTQEQFKTVLSILPSSFSGGLTPNRLIGIGFPDIVFTLSPGLSLQIR